MKKQNIVEKIFCTKIENNKLLETVSDALRCAFSNETTRELIHHADSTNWPYRQWTCFLKMVYSSSQKEFGEKVLSIASKDSPTSIVSMVKKSQ